MVASEEEEKKKMSYEECRKQRVEENKKRMEALNLPQLSHSLRTHSPKPSPVPSCLSTDRCPFMPSSEVFLSVRSLIDSCVVQMKKQAKPRTVEKQIVVVRRSSRVANLPAPDYRDVSGFLSECIAPLFWLLSVLGSLAFHSVVTAADCFELDLTREES